MKRNMELIRKILFEFEKEDIIGKTYIEIEKYTQDEIIYHVYLMAEANLINITKIQSNLGKSFLAKGLTWEGHDFIDKARSDSVWNEAMDKLKKIGVGVTLELLKKTLTQIISQKIGINI